MLLKRLKVKKRNKKYNPNNHRVKVSSVFDTIHLSMPVSEYSQVKLNQSIHGALIAITNGVGKPEHFDVLASTTDLVFMMTMNLFEDAYKSEIENARQAMFRLKDRFHSTGKFAFDGIGYTVIKELIAIHDQLIKQVTGAEVLQFMQARSNAIKSGNFYKGVAERLAA